MNSGIDYGNGQTNIDLETGIRFGIISQNSVLQAWADDSEPVYNCEDCQYEEDADIRDFSEEVDDSFDDEMIEKARDEYYEEKEQARSFCEPICYKYEDQEYKCFSCFDNTEIAIEKSPYYTRGRLCSPCFPGGVNLNDMDEQGEMGYCFNHDWFDEGVAPYPVYRVSDHKEIFAWFYTVKYNLNNEPANYQIVVYGNTIEEASKEVENNLPVYIKQNRISSYLERKK